MDDERLRVCLDRQVELDAVRLRLRDWPGLRGPVVHVPDPLATNERDTAGVLAAALAPRYRVLSLSLRTGVPYQVGATDLLATLDQFGFTTPVLVGEGLAGVAALLVSAWHAGRVAGLVLVDPIYSSSPSDSMEARALEDCPPDVPALHRAVRCPVLVLRQWTSRSAQSVEEFLVDTLGAC